MADTKPHWHEQLQAFKAKYGDKQADMVADAATPPKADEEDKS